MSSHSHPSLPSIRQLHPYLPPTGMSHSANVPAPMTGIDGQPHSIQHYGVHREANPAYAMPESEVDELDQQEPPKKKRRRQALSCTGNYSTLAASPSQNTH
ncbi:hypothetical protein AX17_007193 [Amanita inopinata Kibby_2008]|nr:hypothetical protein AX17_007193 [Amanita inopinata Kibby_2008]